MLLALEIEICLKYFWTRFPESHSAWQHLTYLKPVAFFDRVYFFCFYSMYLGYITLPPNTCAADAVIVMVVFVFESHHESLLPLIRYPILSNAQQNTNFYFRACKYCLLRYICIISSYRNSYQAMFSLQFI